MPNILRIRSTANYQELASAAASALAVYEYYAVNGENRTEARNRLAGLACALNKVTEFFATFVPERTDEGVEPPWAPGDMEPKWSPRIVIVPSETVKDKTYTVRVYADNSATCSCPAFKYSLKSTCKHTEAAQRQLMEAAVS